MKDNDSFTPLAGQHPEPDAPKDDYGNPLGNQFDLGRDGAFQGRRIVIYPHMEMQCFTTYSDSPGKRLIPKLAEKGFSVDVLPVRREDGRTIGPSRSMIAEALTGAC